MKTETSAPASHVSDLIVVLAALSAAAALIHAVVIPEHFEESRYFGAFFTVSSVAQVVWAAWILVRPGMRSAYVLGALGNLAIVGLWLLSRTAGVPLGPEPWTPEPVQAIDVLATLQEVCIAVGATILITRWRPPEVVRLKAVQPVIWLIVTGLLSVTVWQSVAHAS